jgi:hypothetical protein
VSVSLIVSDQHSLSLKIFELKVLEIGGHVSILLNTASSLIE